jgi:ATP-dependent HslUV protease ATP-binding subunit HslU
VAELDKHIVGQTDAKKAVSVALRNRWRRRQVDAALQQEIHPTNILMVGSTGSGKTEIGRRLANIIHSPFVKVEATRYTEVGVYGANTDTMIHDLVDKSYKLAFEHATKKVKQHARRIAEDVIIAVLKTTKAPTPHYKRAVQSTSPAATSTTEVALASSSPSSSASSITTSITSTSSTLSTSSTSTTSSSSTPSTPASLASSASKKTDVSDDATADLTMMDFPRQIIRKWLQHGLLDSTMVEIELPPIPQSKLNSSRMPAGLGDGVDIGVTLSSTDGPVDLSKFMQDLARAGGGGGGGSGSSDLLSSLLGTGSGGRSKKKSNKKLVSVKDALERIAESEEYKLVDEEQIRADAIKLAEESGIVFIDELDKLAKGQDEPRGSSNMLKGEGVQKELLGLIEGTVVNTPRGQVKTDHILFIGSGAFHKSKPSDLLPELQGRLPVRVNLQPLTEADFVKILTITKNNILFQQKALLATEDANIEFTECGIKQICKIAHELNVQQDNIGARRLSMVVSHVLSELSFTAASLVKTARLNGKKLDTISIDAAYVSKRLQPLLTKVDLTKHLI